MLRREGFASGGLVRSYDSGGYLPVGLSMAYNGTGKPEPVGGGGVRSPQPCTCTCTADLAMDDLWERMQAKTLITATPTRAGRQDSGSPGG